MITLLPTIRIRRFDTRNLVVEHYRLTEERSTKKYEYKWKTFGYYGNLQSALKGAIDLALLEYPKDAGDVQSLKEYVEGLYKAIDNLPKGDALWKI